jgi:hypothetical protein
VGNLLITTMTKAKLAFKQQQMRVRWKKRSISKPAPIALQCDPEPTVFPVGRISVAKTIPAPPKTPSDRHQIQVDDAPSAINVLPNRSDFSTADIRYVCMCGVFTNAETCPECGRDRRSADSAIDTDAPASDQIETPVQTTVTQRAAGPIPTAEEERAAIEKAHDALSCKTEPTMGGLASTRELWAPFRNDWHAQIVRGLGGDYLGTKDGRVWFLDAKGGSRTLPISRLNPKEVRRKLGLK